MRKAFYRLLIIGLLFGGIVQQAQAQKKTKSFNLNIGVMTTDVFKGGRNLLTLGVGFDFYLGNFMLISPELQYWNDKSLFGNYTLAPGIILNLKVKHFIFGGGVILPLESKYFLPKINAGLIFKNMKLTLLLIPFFEHGYFDVEAILLGANIGIVF